MAKYTFLMMAEEVLLGQDKALSAFEIWDLGVTQGLDKKLGSKGQTPWDSMNARLLVDFRDNPATAFVRESVKPARYRLKDKTKSQLGLHEVNKQLSSGMLEPGVDDAETAVNLVPTKAAKYPYKERDLHPFVAWFAAHQFGGSYCKTIFHEFSSKKNYTEWLHPDLVGFWFPFQDYNKELLALSGNGLSIARFYSFELKRELNFGNLRESFFQAVSNSSWAHEGYLVAANIDELPELRAELSRLSGSFGIGVIELNLEKPGLSEVIFQARGKDSIDWDGANKLAKENPDFRKFLADVRIDISNARAHASEFDSVPSLEALASLWSNWNTAT
ncbi:HTH domain-containing protein [Pelomonas sp. CA6]|uniref:HTH domain-containing protein n=1 Tax=Pelomonas sp. CA6 TaxID=2907999 RepID=UPI001F4C3F40|nr:HTH domain-containing protein [Pelomonas sp. CA6]MCH7343815.1 HTH domain-containing protein [Pelomonas sp. CA6]